MATATTTKDYTDVELYAVLKLAKTQTVTFAVADIPPAALTTLGQAYLNLVLAKTNEYPFGRALRKFADEQVVLIKAAIAALP